jgi:hypothetical protein
LNKKRAEWFANISRSRVAVRRQRSLWQTHTLGVVLWLETVTVTLRAVATLQKLEDRKKRGMQNETDVKQ